jgi:hypothetical protein
MYPHRRSITTVSVVLTNSLTHQHTFMPSFLLTSYTIYTTLHKGGQCTNPQEIESRYQYWNSHLVNSQHRQHTKCSQLVSFQGFIMVTIFISARDWRMVSVTYFEGYKSIPYSTLSLQFCAIIIRYVIFSVFNELPSSRSGAGHLHNNNNNR